MTLNWHGREYSAEDLGQFGIRVSSPTASAIVRDEVEAVRWLTSRSLRKGKARALVNSGRLTKR